MYASVGSAKNAKTKQTFATVKPHSGERKFTDWDKSILNIYDIPAAAEVCPIGFSGRTQRLAVP